MPNHKQHTPPYRDQHASDPVRTVTRTETFIDLIANNGMTEEENDKLHNPTFPDDGCQAWFLVVIIAAIVLFLFLGFVIKDDIYHFIMNK